ncbi:hypothetical protein EG68_09753 [Paragonimus skrjabini miyazakii]|uniref:DUF4817 domain-containing protein n=1 Tax=Paragonimus skrjabini miyazakii TaxID=59628 RepID=A0A8S9YMF2_9TREM|nr:hypothetical protein EG68_09753 [Paragonimus skrjabini miyazakii]
MGEHSDDEKPHYGLVFTDFERKEMVDLCLGGLSALQASKEFHRRHPNRPRPSREWCLRLTKRFRLTGSVAALVSTTARENPHLTNSQLAAHFGISVRSLVNLLSRADFQRTTLGIHQRTSDEDRAQRVTCCKWFQANDEAVFHLHGVVNHHNLMKHSWRKTFLFGVVFIMDSGGAIFFRWQFQCTKLSEGFFRDPRTLFGFTAICCTRSFGWINIFQIIGLVKTAKSIGLLDRLISLR